MGGVMKRLETVVVMLALAGCGEAVKSGHDGTTDTTVEVTDTTDSPIEVPPDTMPDLVVDPTLDTSPDGEPDTVDDTVGEPSTLWRCECFAPVVETWDVCTDSPHDARDMVEDLCEAECSCDCVCVTFDLCEDLGPCYD
jgi:hypothetical protein